MNRPASRTSTAEPTFDAVVVLGDALLPDDTLSAFGRDRVRRGAELVRQGAAPRMLLAGRGPGRGLGRRMPTEAAAMREEALRLGVGDDELVLEDESDSTLQNAYFVKTRVLEPRGWTRVLLVTSAWHAQRALVTFQRVLGCAFAVEVMPVPDGLCGAELERRRELESYYLGELNAQLEGMVEPDPARLESLIGQRRGNP